jgi:hypothetical protein
MNPEEALTAASRMMQALGDEETNRNFQSAVSQAQNDPMAVIRDMQKYQKMPYPPKETLLLLDSKTSGILVKEWPALSGPLRKSLVETIPTIQDKADRAETVTQMIKATRGVNEMLGQSMRMLDQALQNQPNAVPEENP